MKRRELKGYEWGGFVIVKEGDHYLVTNPNHYYQPCTNKPVKPWTEDTVQDAKVSIKEYWDSNLSDY